MQETTDHSSSHRRSILVVEDNSDLAGLIELHLQDLGCNVTTASDGLIAQQKIQDNHYDLIVLDVMLPGLDGLELCKQIRARQDYVPVLMLTAKSGELDRVLGLEMGADDYLTKPFSIRELLARVKALFRRADAFGKSAPPQNQSKLRVGDFTIDTERRMVMLHNQPIDLTAKEFDLLVHFARHPGRVYTRAQLLDQVWGYGHEGYEHTVNSHINRLRSKIESDPAQPRYILTVWGVGYKFHEPRD